ncbi:MAG: divalent-cation tolerance protein CutA, partial [Candidatus Tectomicrobia bacterium]|nr:divalent-cation tolerance protein CutA [Candidatus Tectomicrobia bacterium]
MGNRAGRAQAPSGRWPKVRDGGAFRLVLVTAGTEEEGARIAHALVEEGLAACANIVPRVRSIYRWKGGVQDEPESLLLIKTTAARLEALSARVGELHSYTVPETIALALDRGRESYLDW